MSEERLSRIEQKIDQLTDTGMSNQITMARVEEKISDLEVRRSESHERVNRISSSIDEIEVNVTEVSTKVDLTTKFLWAITAAIATACLGLLVQWMG